MRDGHVELTVKVPIEGITSRDAMPASGQTRDGQRRRGADSVLLRCDGQARLYAKRVEMDARWMEWMDRVIHSFDHHRQMCSAGAGQHHTDPAEALNTDVLI